MQKTIGSVDSKEPKFLLIDYDWAGPVGEATYPPNVNMVTVDRPKDVDDGKIITVAHDLWMLNSLMGT